MLGKISKLFGGDKKPEVRQVRKKRPLRERIEEEPVGPTEEDLHKGRGLFWEKEPYYPEMGNSYRKLLQRFKMDHKTRVKIHKAEFGIDLCTIAGGSGPIINYSCDDDKFQNITKTIDKFGLTEKIECISDEKSTDELNGHILSLMPQNIDERQMDWDSLSEETTPGGLVIILKYSDPNNDDWQPKMSEKITDNNPFYYFNQVDHTNDWINAIESRLKAIGEMDPEALKNNSEHIMGAFKKEASEWMMTLQKLKSGNAKVISMIYKHDDV